MTLLVLDLSVPPGLPAETFHARTARHPAQPRRLRAELRGAGAVLA
ncbi:DUF1211 domain-containing protein [Streptomyces sp. ST2-7A]|nr:DUF1211 domain-containing protein [Streptomyces sp. ST2-7A]MCE7082861.1 DUF1211 domain-containing protein [Streptomyces sp. ST2-7A]